MKTAREILNEGVSGEKTFKQTAESLASLIGADDPGFAEMLENILFNWRLGLPPGGA